MIGAVDVLPEGALEAKLDLAEPQGRPLRVKLGVDPLWRRTSTSATPSSSTSCGSSRTPATWRCSSSATTRRVSATLRAAARRALASTAPSSTPTPRPTRRRRSTSSTTTRPGSTSATTGNGSRRLPWSSSSRSPRPRPWRASSSETTSPNAGRLISPSACWRCSTRWPRGTTPCIEADIELGGTDQVFNLFGGATWQAYFGQEPQAIMTLDILPGTDGVERMSKSTGNYIGVTQDPRDLYGKIMSIPDGVMLTYYRLLTAHHADELERIEQDFESGAVNPRDLKARLAREVITRLRGAESAARRKSTSTTSFAATSPPPTSRSWRSSPATWRRTATCSCRPSSSVGSARRAVSGGGASSRAASAWTASRSPISPSPPRPSPASTLKPASRPRRRA